MSDTGVWVKLENASFAGATVIDKDASNYDQLDEGVVIDGKTYDIYTFTTPVTPSYVSLTAEARQAIEQAELSDMEGFRMPADFDGDPADLLPENYREIVRDAFEVVPATDPGLDLVVTSEGHARILLVGGGGSGGTYSSAGIVGGGGGAGEMYESDIVLPEGTLAVHVGYGGGLIAADWGAGVYALSGGDASFVADFSACGGGYGGGYIGYGVQGGDGGSGGGAGGGGSFPNVPMQGTVLGRPTGGNEGGHNSTGSMTRSGGGGGAGGPGLGNVATYQDAGGPGKETNITGTPQMMAGGGGGFMSPGGSDIGGAGIYLNNGADMWAHPPTPNTGSGGGAGYNKQVEAGSSGIVIVRVEVA